MCHGRSLPDTLVRLLPFALCCTIVCRVSYMFILYNYIEEIHFQSLINSLISEPIYIGFVSLFHGASVAHRTD
jgi:hypothetical protein